MPCIHETYETIWLIIALFSVGSVTGGFLVGYGLGLLRRPATVAREV